MSRWDVARATIACLGGCRGQIGAGEAVRYVSAGQWPWCVTCVRRRLEMEPPAAMPAPSVAQSLGMSRFAVDLPRDFKVAQSKDGE